MATIPNELKMETMTEVVNNIQTPGTFLTRLLYPRSAERTLGTETVRLDRVFRGRQAAPFVLKHGEAVAVPGREATGTSYETPNIRIKRPLTPSEQTMYFRRPGEQVFVGPGSDVVGQHIRQQIADDLADMVAMVDETKEWMVSRTLQGAISYEVADQEVFTLDFGRDGNNNITLTKMWDLDYPDDPTPLQDIYQAKKIISDHGLAAPTDVILGSEAASAFLHLLERLKIPALGTQSGVQAGSATMIEDFQANGAVFLGVVGGLRFWSYPRTTRFADTSASIPLIRPKYAEFVSVSPLADRAMYYGAIPDMTAIRNSRYRNRVFSKSWEIPDPSGYVALVHSRPLPVPRQVNGSVSMKVVSG